MVHFSVRKHKQPRRNNNSVLRPAHIQPSQLQNISALHQYCITQKNHSGIGNKVWSLLFLLQVLVGTLVINIHGRNIRAVIWLERCNRLAKIYISPKQFVWDGEGIDSGHLSTVILTTVYQNIDPEILDWYNTSSLFRNRETNVCFVEKVPGCVKGQFTQKLIKFYL